MPTSGYHRRVRSLVLLCLTGCDALFRLSTVPDPAGPDGGGDGNDAQPSNCFRESFSGTTADLAANWNRGADSSGCQATVASGELEIEISANISCYADAQTITRPSFVGNSASVRVTNATATGNAETLFTLEIDASNSYYFDVGRGGLGFYERFNGVDMPPLEITYDPVAHAYWQFLYKADGPVIAFRTSADGTSWVERHTVPVVVPLDALRVRLEAGTYNGGDALIHTATFDDFERCAP